jgi:hypothetical protein
MSLEIAEAELLVVQEKLSSAEIFVVGAALAEDPSPLVPYVFHLNVLAVPAEHWDRLQTGLGGNAQDPIHLPPHLIVPVADGHVLAFGIRTRPPSRQPHFISSDLVQLAADALKLPVTPTRWQSVVGEVLSGLTKEHASRVRALRRPASWPRAETSSDDQWRNALSLDGPPSWLEARGLLEELDRTISRADGSIEGFVNSVSSGSVFPDLDIQSRDIVLPTAASVYAIQADIETANLS